ncbi:MAG: hypothetical protein ACRDTH_16585 [Pseudonocardiaceae bacterium]
MGQDRTFLRQVALDPGTILTCRRLLMAPDDVDPLSLIGHFER